LKRATSKRDSRNRKEPAKDVAIEETLRMKQMREASESMDRLRESSKTTGWSGAQEIRKWRDRDQGSKS
jgi:hypothetical protein